jgi:hypothetical protein
MTEPSPPTHEAGFLRIVAAVLSSFIGIRKRASLERDMISIKPQHVIVAGIIAALCFIAILATTVHFIVAK